MSEKKTPSSNTGKPGTFKKGPDPRRHMNGQISKERLAFNISLRECLIAEGEREQTGSLGEQTLKLKKVEWLVKSVWSAAIKGESWAVNFIAERVEGKVPMNVGMEHSGAIDGKFTVEVVHLPGADIPDNNNGNGNGNGNEGEG